jgi:gas vesicle protein
VDSENTDTWKRKWATADGIAKAAGPRLAAKIRDLQDLVDGNSNALRDKDAAIADLQGKLAEAMKAQPDELDTTIAGLKEDFGPENKMVLAMEKQQKLIKALQSKVSEPAKAAPVADVPRETVDDPQSKFWYQVNMAVPDFDEINGMTDETGKAVTQPKEGWIELLNTVEPVSGKKYREIAVDHMSRGNVAGVKNLVELYKAKKPVAAVVAPTGKFKGVDEMIEPTTKGGQTVLTEKPTFSRAESLERIADFQRRGNPRKETRDEFNKWFGDYTNAISDKRVT